MFIRTDGSPKFAMVAITTGAILNIILDPIFIFTLDMRIQGAALATIISQSISAIIVLSYFRKMKSIYLKREYFKPTLRDLKQICILGLPAGSMQIAVILVQIVMNNTLGYYGEQSIYGREIPLAVAGVVSKVNAFSSRHLSALSRTVSPFLVIIMVSEIIIG